MSKRVLLPGETDADRDQWEAYLLAKSLLTDEQIERVKAKCEWEHMTWFAVYKDWPSLFAQPDDESGPS